MQAPQFEFMREFLLRESGLVVEPHKMYLLRSRLQPVAREHGLKDLNELADAIRYKRDMKLAREVVDAMTTNETLFFRDGYPFEALREIMLPDCRKNGSAIRIWSAAASTGQEAWSIAITALESMPDAASRVRIIGTDISRRALAKAEKAVYSRMEVSRGMPPDLLRKYFEQDDREWRLKSRVRQMARFMHANLVSPRMPEEMRPYGPFDIVFCRNVLIYFDVDTRRDVVDNLARCMRKGGWLVNGATEIPQGRRSRWEPVAVGNRNLWRLAAAP